MTTTSICVRYKNVEDWHVFESEELPGLYVASKDRQKAYEDVPQSITLLLRLIEGIDCTVTPELTFKEFVAKLRVAKDKDGDNGRLLIMEDKRFIVAAAA